MHKCAICGIEVNEHTIEQATLCYYKSRLPRDESD